MRFDEVELEAVPLGGMPVAEAPPEAPLDLGEATLVRRTAALLIDLSLFAALTLALTPLLPPTRSWMALTALAGFVIMVSFYYFVGSWLLWGRTIGGAIFDVRVVSTDRNVMPLRSAVRRWSALYLSLATATIGFLLAALPSRRSLADRLSQTRCVSNT